jgi:hypothetical protein
VEETEKVTQTIKAVSINTGIQVYYNELVAKCKQPVVELFNAKSVLTEFGLYSTEDVTTAWLAPTYLRKLGGGI